jgi:hypothetical protein
MNNRYKLATALTLATSLTSFADVKVNDSLTVSGYAAGSYRTTDPDPGPATDKFDLDAVKTLFQTNLIGRAPAKASVANSLPNPELY